MKLLLHICCAPCSTEVIERLQKEHVITGFFYNPNIQPDTEHRLRLDELEWFSKDAGFGFIPANYDVEEWFDSIKGLEDEPEGGKRCEVCFRLRLKKTAETARKGGFEAFTTTLTISPHKDANVINNIGKELGQTYGINFLSENFKKKDGFKRSIEHSRLHGLNRQDYCGCVFSRSREGL